MFLGKQRKLSDLFEERNEQAPMDEEYPLMAFIANIGVAPKGDRYDRSALVHDEKGKKYKRTEKGDFVELASDYCICYWNPKDFRSGTGQTVRMAQKKGIEIINMR